MKKYIFLLIISFSTLAFSQINMSGKTMDNKWRFGGGIGLGFGGKDYFGLNISPFLGYELTKSLEAGITTGYQYSKWKNSKQNVFSAGPYLNAYPIPSLFLRTHYEYFTGSQTYTNFDSNNEKFKFDESALWLGAGYRNTGKVSFYTGIMYNVLYKKNDSKLFSTGLRPIAGVSIGF